MKATENPLPVTLQRLIYLAREPPRLNHLHYPTNAYISHLSNKILQIEERIMASKNTPKPNNRNFTEITFVNMKITGKHKEGFNEWMSRKEAEIALDAAAFMSNGHKTSITWDVSNNVWIVSATCKESTSPNVDKCLTSRSSEWWEALCMNVYKHNIMCSGGSWSENEDETDWG